MPKKTTRKKLLLSLLGLILCVGLVTFVWLPKPHANSYSLEFERLGDQGLVIKSDASYALTNKHIAITRDYYHKSINDYRSKEEISPRDYSEVDIYKTDGKGKPYKTIDLLKIIQAYNDNYLPSVIGVRDIVIDNTNEEEYLLISVYDIPKIQPINSAKSIVMYDLYINIEKETIIEDKIRRVDSTPENFIWESTNDSSDDRAIFYDSSVFSNEVTNVHKKLAKLNLKTEVLPGIESKKGARFSDTRLGKRYPKAADLLSKGAEVFWFGEIRDRASLLASEDETDIFQGVTLYGKYSKDGKDHFVQSYDELMQWYHKPETGENNE